MESQSKRIENYIRPDGKCPFTDWVESLRESRAKLKIDNRLRQVQLGNLSDFDILSAVLRRRFLKQS